MIKFNYKDISVDATIETEELGYKDAHNRRKTHLARNIGVVVRFWDFSVIGDLTELAFIKSILIYFMHCFWKRSRKEGSKIVLAKTLLHAHTQFGPQTLFFTARQKNGQHFLHLCLQQGGKVSNEIYLDPQEILMLDIAIYKAISLLKPDSSECAPIFE